MKALYVILSRTGTILSRAISKITGDWYTHASVSLDDNLQTMYSFGRRWAHNPWIGGFVKESVNFGTMRRFCRADTLVIQVPVSESKYTKIKNYLTQMYVERKKYRYNYWGLFFSQWKIRIRAPKRNRFYCSEFVTDCLERFQIIHPEELGKVVRPMELLQLRKKGKGKVVYRGELCRFALSKN